MKKLLIIAILLIPSAAWAGCQEAKDMGSTQGGAIIYRCSNAEAICYAIGQGEGISISCFPKSK